MSDLFERLSNLPPKRLALLAMELQERLDRTERARREPIAIVGMGCRFPGADDPAAYWRLLAGGVDAIREIPPSRFDVDALYDPDPDAPGKIATRWAGLLDGIDRFEPQLFGIAPREARSMDPQQRLLLEVAWEALEHAGIAPDSLAGTPAGVYVGICNADYAQLMMEGDGDDFDMYLSTGNASSVASGRLSYVFGLQGPAITVDTACSSSLVAVHLAVQGLRTGACRVALAGGANVLLSAKTTMTLSRAKMMASDGRCKTFDASADGFVRGEGAGLVVLKRLADAEADGDRIHAVIHGSAVNQDGRSNGLTAPNGPSQVAVIRAALADAGVQPARIGYVEAHGTGTALGDPIEVQALAAALRSGDAAGAPLVVGSAKTNIGHLESAAGIAGLIKVVLMHAHGQIPPLVHLVEPSPQIPWERLPIELPTTLTPWTGEARLAGLSSFGFSGTNAHLVIGPAPSRSAPDERRPGAHVVTLRARTDDALLDTAQRWATALAEQPDRDLAEIARTANTGRAELAHRLAVVADGATAVAASLQAFVHGGTDEGSAHGVFTAVRAPDVAFLFTGHGSQRPGMGRQLFEDEPVFRDAIRRCADVLAPLLDEPLETVLYDEARSEALLADMTYAQPAVFAVEHALAELWASWGVRPTIVAGHSVGEYVAAVVAGAMSLEDGLRLVAARGRLMASLPADGQMATAFVGEAVARAAIAAVLGEGDQRVSIGAIIGPASVALSGVDGRLEPVLAELRAAGAEIRPLNVPIAAHSAQIDPILDEFEAVAATVTYHPLQLDVVSGMTGRLAAGDDLVTAAYWRRHLRQPVRFGDAVATIHDRGGRVFVEAGPHPTLLNMARHVVPEHECAWLPSLRAGRDDRRQMLHTLGELFVRGVPVRWDAVVAPATTPAELPTYPFERERYWIDARPAAPRAAGEHPLLGRRIDTPALDRVVHESALGAHWPAYLDHHRIHGVVLLPSPAFLEMAIAAWRATVGAAPLVVRDLEIRQALILPDDGERLVQLLLDGEADDTGERRFEVVSHDGPGAPWTVHATGRLAVDELGSGPATTVVDEARRRCTEHVDGPAFYDCLAGLGLEFGTGLQGVTEIWRRDGEAVARVELAPELAREAGRYGVHPALLDACFHVLGAPVPASVDAAAALLVGIETVRVHGAPGSTLWVHVTLRDGFDEPGASDFGGDVCVFREDGSPVVEALGVHLRLASREALLRATRGPGRDWQYEVAWVPAPVAEPASAGADERWVVIDDGDDDGLAAALAAELGDRGGQAAVVTTPGPLPVFAAGGRVVDLRARHLGMPGDGGVPGPAVLGALVAGVQQLVAAADAADATARLWMVTRAATAAGDGPVRPLGALAWGLGRVIAVEHPELWGGIVDLDAGPATVAEEAGRLADVLLRRGDDDQFALRSTGVLVPRLRRRRTSTGDGVRWRADAAYLVVGGLGGLGLELCQWLAACGAGTIVLTGRTGLAPRAEWDALLAAGATPRLAEQIRAIRGAEALGAVVHVEAVDVADPAGMAALIGRFGSDLPELAGVVHAAAALGDAPVASMTPTQIDAMLRPKVAGAWLLHELTAALPLDFFVLFSSTAALWGSRSLGHYAAANAFLDALAVTRRRRGLPALSISWGTWDEMRVATDAERAEMASGGLLPMATDDALTALSQLLGERDLAHVAVAAVDWSVLKPAYEARRPRPFLADVGAQAGPRRTRSSGPAELLARLDGVPEPERFAVVADFLRGEVAHALGATDPLSIDIEQGLFDMGMDSLMSVELKGRVEVAVGRDLPSTLTFNYPNVAALAGYLLDEVLTDADAGPPADGGLAAVAGASLAADADADADLSEDDLADMLASRLASLRRGRR